MPHEHREEGKFMPSIDMNFWRYKIIDGKTIKVLPIYHPSVGFSWEYWHEVIVEFFKM